MKLDGLVILSNIISSPPKKKNDSGLLWWLRGKELAAHTGDTGSIPGLGRCHVTQSN